MRFRINIRRIFVTGIFIVLPALVTWFLLAFLLEKVDYFVTPYLRKALPLLPGYEWIQGWANPFLPILSLILVLAVIFFIGVLGTNFLGRRIIAAFDRVVMRIPLVKGIYGAMKQLFDTLDAPGARAFEGVVLFEFPRKGVYVVAFVTRPTVGEVAEATDEETLYLFVPTTPNPTSGWLLIAARSEVIPLKMSVEEGVKLVISGGIVSPPTAAQRLGEGGEKAVRPAGAEGAAR